MRPLLSLVLAFAVASVSLFALDPVHAQKQSTSWTAIETFEGKNRAQTNPFTVDASKWRVKWKSTSKIPGGLGHVVQIYVLYPDSKSPAASRRTQPIRRPSRVPQSHFPRDATP